MRLLHRLRLLVVMSSLSVAGAYAEGARELAWEDLLPPELEEIEREASELQQRLRKLKPDERKAFTRVSRELAARDKIALGYETEETLTQKERDLLAENPSAANPEALAFWTAVKDTKARLESLNGVVDKTLNEQRVRIPGYVLPLEFHGKEVSEFLLVPFVGACIHVPAPPANQMVFVKAPEGVSSEGLYAPVWVEGKILSTGGEHDLSLKDGSAPVDSGYTIEQATVEPYK